VQHQQHSDYEKGNTAEYRLLPAQILNWGLDIELHGLLGHIFLVLF
jgi:hypothetical protein